MEIMTNKDPVLTEIVVIWSTCTVHRDPKNKSLGGRGKVGIIIKRGIKTKMYEVYIPVDKVVMVTQRFQSVEAPHNNQDGRNIVLTRYDVRRS